MGPRRPRGDDLPPDAALGRRLGQRARRAHVALILSAALVACEQTSLAPDAGLPDAGDGPGTCTELPSEGLWATFRVATTPVRHFRALLTRPAAIASALDGWARHTTPTIPMGELRCRAPVGWNCGWRWHQDPSSVEIVEAAIELCDGAPPITDADCDALSAFADGLWCPWMAQLVELRDCRAGAACELVPR